MTTVLTRISEIGIVPVIAIHDVQHAVPLAKALLAGGIACAEITFRTEHAEEAMRRIAAEVPDILLGAGTVTTRQQADRAIAAGAKFIVSPGLNPKIAAYCLEKDIPITPGCATPSDIEAALEMGIDTVKFFPAEQSGGLAYIKAVSAPYPTVRFMPTGGINVTNLSQYLAFDKVIACGGSWMVPPALVNAGNFEEITRLCQDAMKVVLGFSLAHIGVNGANEEQAKAWASLFAAAFNMEVRTGNASVFAGNAVEVMKAPFKGQNGHIAIGVQSIARAKRYLTGKGFSFDESTAKTDAKGKPQAIYFSQEIGGFALHLLQK